MSRRCFSSRSWLISCISSRSLAGSCSVAANAQSSCHRSFVCPCMVRNLRLEEGELEQIMHKEGYRVNRQESAEWRSSCQFRPVGTSGCQGWKAAQAAARSKRLRGFRISTDGCSDLETTSVIPINWAWCFASLSPNALYMISGTVGIKRFRTRAASKPFIPGMEKSSTIRSGCNSRPSQLLLFHSRLFPIFQNPLLVGIVAECLTDERIIIHDQYRFF